MSIDPAILSSLSALLGACIGGTASLAAAAYTQRYHDRNERIAREVTKRETVYADFILAASRAFLSATVHDRVLLGENEQQLIGLINRVRLFAPSSVVEGADAVIKAIVETALSPKIELNQVAKLALSQGPDPDPLRKFSLVCRVDLDQLPTKLA